MHAHVSPVSRPFGPNHLGPKPCMSATRSSGTKVTSCALVSSSGALLAAKQGAFIDKHELVARIGLSPTARFEAHAGSRTSVRFIQLSFFEAVRNMSQAKLRAVLEHDRLTTPSLTVTFTGTEREIQKLKLKHVATRFMRRELPRQPFSTISPLPRCNMAGCKMNGRRITSRYPSSGVLALQSMFDHHQCASVRLFGFDDPNHGSRPYHYWNDGSVHDGQSSQDFYHSKLRQSSSAHDFEAEHWFLRYILGKGSWIIDAPTYRVECIHPERAPACTALPRRPGYGESGIGQSAIARTRSTQGSKQLLAITAPFSVLPQHWSRAQAAVAREQVLDAMRLCHDTGEGGDNRTMGVSDVAKVDSRRFHLITAFVQDRRLHKMAAAHLGMAPRDVRVKTLAGSTAPGQSSGGGWHKDGLTRGFKALLYLDDVADTGRGPFAMLLNYSDATLKHAKDWRRRRTRFDEAAVRDQVERGAQIRHILGDAGTVVVFETSSVHRGLPARTGGRVTLTNYYHNDIATCGAKNAIPVGAVGRHA